MEMAITQYQENNATFFKVRVNLRSPNVPGLRVERKKSGIRSRSEALKLERQYEKECERALFEKESKGISWERIINEWELAAKTDDIFIKRISQSTIDDYMGTLHRFTKDWFRLNVCDIDRSIVWRALEKIEREHSVSSRKRLRTAINSVFEWGIHSGKIKDIKSIPTEGYKTKIRVEEKIPEILNIEEIKILIKSAKISKHHWYPVWAMALMTGMRSGELYAMRWSKIDFQSNVIYVHENWTNKDGLGSTKGRYWRTVPISPELGTFLKALKASNQGFSEKLWTWADNKKLEKKPLSIHDFVLPRFQSWKDGRQAEILRTFCEGVGISSVKFHTLRACFATQLIKDGIAPAIIMKICGWRELKTMQRYVRLAGIEVKGATDGLKILPPEEAMGRIIELFQN